MRDSGNREFMDCGGSRYQDFNAAPVLLRVYGETGEKMGKTFSLLKENLPVEGSFGNLQSMKFNFTLCLSRYPHFNKTAIRNGSTTVIAEQSGSRDPLGLWV